MFVKVPWKAILIQLLRCRECTEIVSGYPDLTTTDSIIPPRALIIYLVQGIPPFNTLIEGLLNLKIQRLRAVFFHMDHEVLIASHSMIKWTICTSIPPKSN